MSALSHSGFGSASSKTVNIHGYTQWFIVNPGVKIYINGKLKGQVKKGEVYGVQVSGPCLMKFRCHVRSVTINVDPNIDRDIYLSFDRMSGCLLANKQIDAMEGNKQNICNEDISYEQYDKDVVKPVLQTDGERSLRVSQKTELEEENVRESVNNSEDIEQISLGNSDQLSSEHISGWLSLFLVALPIGAFFSLLMNISAYSPGNNSWIDVAFCFILLATAVITDMRFLQRKSDAVFLAKTYLVSTFCINLLIIILVGSQYESSSNLYTPIIGAIIWFIYLSVSKQVKRIIPVSIRTVTPLAKGILISIIIVPILFYCFLLAIIY